MQLVAHRDIDALTNRGELMALSRAYGLLPTGDLETLRARLHDFVDWKGTAGERVSLSPRVLLPSLGPPRVRPVRIPTPSEIERIADPDELRKLAKALHLSPSGSTAQVRALVHAAVIGRMHRSPPRSIPPEPRADNPKLPETPGEDLDSLDALRAELLRVMKGMGEVETQLNARVGDLESGLETVSRERSALKTRHDAVDAKSQELARREKETLAAATNLAAWEAEIVQLGESVKASAALLSSDADRVKRELEDVRMKESVLARKEETIAWREGALARTRKELEEVHDVALEGKEQLLAIQAAQVRVREEALNVATTALEGKRDALAREHDELAARRDALSERAARLLQLIESAAQISKHLLRKPCADFAAIDQALAVIAVVTDEQRAQPNA